MPAKFNPALLSPARELRKNMTKEERHLWYDFLRTYPVKFTKQKIIGNYIVDFYCAKAGLVIELDGSQHYEAADILGYKKIQTFFHIILPQVIKRIMPSITNEVVTLVKDTSMAFTVSYQELFTIGKQIANSETSFMPFVVAGVFYFVFNAIVDYAMGKVEKSMNYYK